MGKFLLVPGIIFLLSLTVSCGKDNTAAQEQKEHDHFYRDMTKKGERKINPDIYNFTGTEDKPAPAVRR